MESRFIEHEYFNVYEKLEQLPSVTVLNNKIPFWGNKTGTKYSNLSDKKRKLLKKKRKR